ncbi:putative helicase mov-10-B.1 isoform X2 [Sitodiplosis mosellana]|uniref:putative helicase mov-10-B.1 isoform X2 n=1 Tax=Sitodiplosis mosellana TaxID=263140 RepID=UPI0024446D70|nr:putative helicase mov-10-B.1 isoform X2 [Sitodiplosis mosellana]XP_055319848.1 putative helicase mov-10-B.1 isoform X2 [Sitodiplosis mosellana]XP_055319849.1 putative helicase mov-10-B.1 isoform X2 [Sitodiplosis mosellana]
MHPENSVVKDCSSSSSDYVECKSEFEHSKDVDDGYSKSEESSSYHSASDVSVDEKSTVSNTSGLASATSSNQLSINESNSEVVQKILVSRKVNDAIFKPDYRFSVKHHGQPKYWHEKGLADIDLLKEHTKENEFDTDEAVDVVSKWITARSKLYIRVSLEKNANENDDPMIRIHIRNDRLKHPVVLLHLLWINLYENQIVTMDSFSGHTQATIPYLESLDFNVPVKKFDLSKDYKLVIYYGSLALLFSKEFILKITTRPISTMYMEKLDHYFPEPSVRQLDRHHYKVPNDADVTHEVELLKKKIDLYEKSDASDRLNDTNYYSMCKLLLQMEDETDSKRSLRHDQHNQKVKHEFGKRYSLHINNKRLEAALNEYTRIWITPMSIRTAEISRNKTKCNGQQGPVGRSKKERIYGSVVEIKGNKVHFELNETLHRLAARTHVEPADEEYFIRFMSDRTTATLEHRALEYVNNQGIAHFFFPNITTRINWPVNKTHPSSFADKPIAWDSNDINDEQKLAVKNILRQTSYPFPYLLFGPPGTGKTKTLIETVLQIIRNNNPDEYILVCATSNSACNEVAKRLLQSNGGKDKVFRIFSKSVAFKMDDIPTDVLAASNLKTGEHYYPSLQYLYQCKVIVCTLTTAGRLSQGKINPKHFSHIFIDEAGSATESQTMIAIAGLCSTKNELHANLIFAGDPKQLGPLIKSQQAVKMGYGISMLERLITTNSFYMRDKRTNEFNSNYVVQLICNYRSHPSILHPSNKLYYDNALQACAPKSNTDWFIDTTLLKQPQFPVIFRSVKGTTVKDVSNPSPYNQLEVQTTMEYLRRIFKMPHREIAQSDVGIISPYRRQCEELMEKCKTLGYDGIQIGSVEVFQGQEKPIIIVSTVRSQMNNLGFLDSKKRLNVLMTRAKCLLIVIGDADTLAKDEDWLYLINFCRTNNSLIE